MKPFWIRKAIKFFCFGLAFFGLMGWVTQWLWNTLLPAILDARPITFWQALGLLVLSRILFGGWGRGGGWRGKGEQWHRAGVPAGRKHWKEKMAERWEKMPPEQREALKNRWKDRCK